MPSSGPPRESRDGVRVRERRHGPAWPASWTELCCSGSWMWLSQAKYLIKLNLIMLSLDDVRFFCVQVGPAGAAAAGVGAGAGGREEGAKKNERVHRLPPVIRAK